MAVLVGIDEAGYGPILGPLVVSSSSFSVPRDLLDGDMWEALRKSVGMAKKKLAGRLLIVDSKKACTKANKIKHLERTSLACFKCLGKKVATAGHLINELCPGYIGKLAEYKWYKDIERKKLGGDEADISLAGHVLGSDMESNGVSLLGMQSRCLDAGHYNQMVDKVRNKATVLFSTACELIKDAFDEYGANEELQIIVDRQGGKVRYGSGLLRMFGGDLKILKESPAISSYEILSDGKKMRVHFVVKADGRFLPVSLSSMVSKYLREVFMEEINRYFGGFCADLKPTAGYWQDGLRFLGDIEQFWAVGTYEKDMLVRCR